MSDCHSKLCNCDTGFVKLKWVCCLPADPPFNAYPAVIGAAIGGMIIATIITVLLFMYVVRNRNNNPRELRIFNVSRNQTLGS